MKRIYSLLLAVVMLLSVVCVTACSGATVTVTFDSQTGEVTTKEAKGGKVELPPNPENSRANFVGWFLDKEGKTVWVNNKLQADVTVYAKYDKAFVIKLDANYPNAPALDSITVFAGCIPTFPQVTRTNYNFDGWYTGSVAGTKWGETQVVTGKTTLYAHWSIVDHQCDMQQTEVVSPTCTEVGGDLFACTICGKTELRNTVDATGHDYSAISYLNYECANGCGTIKNEILSSNRIYDETFKYTFTAEQQAQVLAQYDQLIAFIDAMEAYDQTKHAWAKPSALYDENKAFEQQYFDVFSANLDTVIEQYQFAYVQYSVANGQDGTQETLDAISDLRTDMISKYYKLFRLIYETKSREYFFSEEDGWSQEDIEIALQMSDKYGKQEYSDIQKRIDQIQLETEAIIDAMPDDASKFSNEFLDLFEELVNKNNQLAKLSGYDNYMDYAYENVYERSYTPDDVAKMSAFVKQYVGQRFYDLVYKAYGSSSTMFTWVAGQGYVPTLSGVSKVWYDAICADSFFNNALSANFVGKYFNTLKTEKVDDNKNVDFYHHANELLKNGNYFTGNDEGAYSYWIGSQDNTVLYFGPGSYSSAFTFIHEFGHYYNNVYNPNLSVSMDHDETQSQGDEMLFLSFIKNNLKDNDVYTTIYYEQMISILQTVTLSVSVNEFEQAVYTNYYDADGYRDGIAKQNYQALFEMIANKYKVGQIYDVGTYWGFVCASNPAYYISYAMSALPALEIFAKGLKEGYDSAKDSYLKLYTFSDNQDFVAHLDNDELDMIATYEQVLEFAGLHSAFDEDLYKLIEEQIVLL